MNIEWNDSSRKEGMLWYPETCNGRLYHTPCAEVEVLEEEEGYYSVNYGKWEYYSVCWYDSVEEYKEGEENYEKETPMYMGYDEDIPTYNTRTPEWFEFLWYTPEEGTVLQVHPRRSASFGVYLKNVPGELTVLEDTNWEAWWNGESYVDSTWVVKNGVCVPYEE